VHALTQALRAVARIAAPAVVFQAEAIVGPSALADYLGTGPHEAKVSDLAYHNSLTVQVWSTGCSRRTGPPVTGGSAAAPRPWPVSRLRCSPVTRTTWTWRCAGCCWRTWSCSASVAYRCRAWATSSDC
jgi:hypothetical protein